MFTIKNTKKHFINNFSNEKLSLSQNEENNSTKNTQEIINEAKTNKKLKPEERNNILKLEESYNSEKTKIINDTQDNKRNLRQSIDNGNTILNNLLTKKGFENFDEIIAYINEHSLKINTYNSKKSKYTINEKIQITKDVISKIENSNDQEKNKKLNTKNSEYKEKIEFNKEKINKAIEWYKGKPKESIKKLQTLINEHSLSITKLNPIKIDGIIGEETIKAIMTFQEIKNLDIDGKSGKNTLKALDAENPNTFYNKNEKKSTSIEKKEQEKKEVEIKYGVNKAEIIKSAMQFLKENSLNPINIQAPIGTYTIDGETHNIVLKGEPGNYKVELDGSGIIDDYEQKVLGNTVKDINKAVNQLIINYKKELKKEKGDNYIKQGINYIDNLFDGSNEKNINPEFNKIIEKLEKDGIIGKTTINIDSGDYKGDYKLTFKIDGDKLILDSAWNQPGTDKEIKIDINEVIGKTNDQIMEYINMLKNNLIIKYKNQVTKQIRNNNENIINGEKTDFDF